MRWPLTRSILAASISAPPAAKCTLPLMPEIAGRLSFAIFQRCFPSRCRRCHDRCRAPAAFANARARHRRCGARSRGPVTQRRSSTRSRPAIRCCAERFAIRSQKSAGRSCDFLPAKGICRTNRRTLRCLSLSPRARSHFSSSERLPAASGGSTGLHARERPAALSHGFCHGPLGKGTA